MKVVLFCGGLGMRIREADDRVPKPMVTIGYRPILWHVMKYYAHFGHKDFILCLGYRGDAIKEYFLNYNECISNDFTLSDGGKQLELMNSDINDWRITFADTGVGSNIGQRLKAVEKHLAGEREFLANYSDGLTNLPLPSQLAHFRGSGAIGTFVCVKPNLSYHLVSLTPDGRVGGMQEIGSSSIRINGGYFAFRTDIFNYLHPDEELVEQPFQRLIAAGRLAAFPYNGFWMPMDTFKDRQRLEELYARGNAPWQVWKTSADERNAPHPTAPSADVSAVTV